MKFQSNVQLLAKLLILPAYLLGTPAFCDDTKLSTIYQVAKQKCKDIACVRLEIDKINQEILDLLTARTAYVKRAGDIKAQASKVAQDHSRVVEQEKKIGRKSIELELPLKISIPTFRTIVETSIQFEQEYIDQLGQN